MLSSPEPAPFIPAPVLLLRGPASSNSPWSLPKRLALQGNEQLLPRRGHLGKLYLFQIPTDWHPRVVIPASSPIRPRLASQLCHLGGCGISLSWQGDVPVRGDKQDPPWEACEDDSRYGQSREAQSLCFPAVWPGHNLSAFLTLLLPEKIGVTGLKTSSVVKMTCGCAPRVQLTVWQSQCCGNRRLLLSRGCLRWAGPLRSASFCQE